jgi:hypothetical protein
MFLGPHRRPKPDRDRESSRHPGASATCSCLTAMLRRNTRRAAGLGRFRRGRRRPALLTVGSPWAPPTAAEAAGLANRARHRHERSRRRNHDSRRTSRDLPCETIRSTFVFFEPEGALIRATIAGPAEVKRGSFPIVPAALRGLQTCRNSRPRRKNRKWNGPDTLPYPDLSPLRLPVGTLHKVGVNPNRPPFQGRFSVTYPLRPT